MSEAAVAMVLVDCSGAPANEQTGVEFRLVLDSIITFAHAHLMLNNRENEVAFIASGSRSACVFDLTVSPLV